jgi:ankyrin repeat protein
LLIECGAEHDIWNGEQKTLLDLALGNGKLDVASLLVKCGSNVNSQDDKGWTPSHSVAWNGHLSLLELLLGSGTDIGMWNRSNKMPIDLALENKKHDVTSFLAMCSSSGSICALNTASLTPLEAGSQNGLPQVVEQQLDDGGPSDNQESDSLHTALESGHLDLIQRLLDHGADVNERNKISQTLLDVASKDGKLEVVRTLIRSGADVNCRDSSGYTPLHVAIVFGHIDVVQLLLDN